MEILCPSCGKPNASAPCQRCGCDLDPLFAIRQAAAQTLAAAAGHLRRGEANEARAEAQRSWKLHKSPEAAALSFLALIALEDFTGALAWRARL